jgi:hypothetical protein
MLIKGDGSVEGLETGSIRLIPSICERLVGPVFPSPMRLSPSVEGLEQEARTIRICIKIKCLIITV